jgi:hypothetical protein
MRTYPKFLKTMPMFCGLAPADLLVLGGALFVSLVLDLTPLKALLLSGGMMVLSKIIRTNFDLAGWLMPSYRSLRIKEEWRDSSL